MPTITSQKKPVLLALIHKHAWNRIAETEWHILNAAIPALKPEDLQRIVDPLGIPVEPPWSGVRQHTLEDLENSLDALTRVYLDREDLRRFCRVAVIRAKDRAKWAARNSRASEEKRRLKSEMAEWMLVWLGDPALFPEWARLRQNRLPGSKPEPRPAR